MAAGELLLPVVSVMKRDLLEGGYIQADETPIGVQSKETKGRNHQGYDPSNKLTAPADGNRCFAHRREVEDLVEASLAREPRRNYTWHARSGWHPRLAARAQTMAVELSPASACALWIMCAFITWWAGAANCLLMVGLAASSRWWMRASHGGYSGCRGRLSRAGSGH